MVGIAPQSEMRSRSIRPHHLLGVEAAFGEDQLGAGRERRAHARVDAGHVEEGRGEEARRLLAAGRERARAAQQAPARLEKTMPSTWVTVPRCVVMQPFGRPVVPEV